MTNRLPPPAPPRSPHLVTLKSGTVLFRIHQSRFRATQFNPVPSHRYYGGGRFDSTEDDRYGYLYAGDSIDVAIAETFLRDIPFADSGPALLPLNVYDGRRITSLVVDDDMELVDLRGLHDLAAVGQTTWLTQTDPRDYAQTRHWAHWLRSHAPTARGFMWRSHREPMGSAIILFDDSRGRASLRITSKSPVPHGDEADFSTQDGRTFLSELLAWYGVTITT